MSNKVFDILKWVAIVVFPAIATCVVAILTAIGYPNTAVVGAILTAIETMLGTILGVSSISYYKKLADYDLEFDALNEIDDMK